MNAILRSLGLVLKLWEPQVRMVGLRVPKIILGVSMEHRAGDRGPMKRLVGAVSAKEGGMAQQRWRELCCAY